jgi:capsular polysaccharide biosynthesis protein
MDLLSIVNSLWRHKIIAIPIIVFTALAAFYTVKIKAPVYQASASVLLANPQGSPTPAQIAQNPKLKNINPYNTFVGYGNLQVVGDILIEVVTGPAAQPALTQAGVDPRYKVVLNTDYGNPPIIDITGVGTSPQKAILSANVIAATLKADLVSIQKSQGIYSLYSITAINLVTPTQAQPSSSGKLRSLIAVLALGAILLFVAVSVTDAIDRRKRDSSGSNGAAANGARARAVVGDATRPDLRSIGARSRQLRLSTPAASRDRGERPGFK